MALPDELDITERGPGSIEAVERAYERLIDAIDAASDQDHTTWLVVDGKRIARIAPVDEIPPGTAAWAADAGISASEFMALSAGRRREILDQFYTRLHGGPPQYPPGRVVITLEHGSETAEHDGFPPHTHAIRSDHAWLPRS